MLKRARDDHDPVVAARLDQDRRGHRRQGAADDAARVHALLGPELERSVAEGVLADCGEEDHLRAEARGPDGLVRPLPAVVGAEERPDQRLAALRRALDPEREPDAVAADDRDPRHRAILGPAYEASVSDSPTSTRRGFEPSYGEMIPRRSSMSISRPARV